MNVIHQLRAGAPDKFALHHSKKCVYVKHDFTNLVDMSEVELYRLTTGPQYILPADEGDILKANKFSGRVDQSHILLPQHEITGKVIDYYDFVPKNSIIYRDFMNSDKMFYYPQFETVDVDNFDAKHLFDKIKSNYPKAAFKSTTGSGSRGVWIVDPDRVHLGGKFIPEMTVDIFTKFIEYCRDNKCNFIIQEVTDPSLLKVNVDFVIRDRRLLGYKWDVVNQSQQFTNWDTGEFVRNKYTDEVMNRVVSELVAFGVSDAIMNFEAASDLEHTTQLIEFNWRYSNSMFEWQALGIDPIQQYLDNKDFMSAIPMDSRLKFTRYWQCKLYTEL